MQTCHGTDVAIKPKACPRTAQQKMESDGTEMRAELSALAVLKCEQTLRKDCKLQNHTNPFNVWQMFGKGTAQKLQGLRYVAQGPHNVRSKTEVSYEGQQPLLPCHVGSRPTAKRTSIVAEP